MDAPLPGDTTIAPLPGDVVNAPLPGDTVIAPLPGDVIAEDAVIAPLPEDAVSAPLPGDAPPAEDDIEQLLKQMEIDDQKADRERKKAQEEQAHSTQIKGIILGTGSSGKSTLMRLINNEYNKSGSKIDESMLRQEMEQSLVILLNYMIMLEHKSTQQQYQMPERENYPGMANMLEDLWQRHQPQWPGPPGSSGYLWSCAPYLMKYVKPFLRGSSQSYKFTDFDRNLMSLSTSGIVQSSFQMDIPGLEPFEFALCDPGGHRSERRKWVHILNDVAVWFYMIDLSSYMHILYEDSDATGIPESVKLFGELVSAEWSSNSNLVVMFNQYDVFATSIRLYPLPETDFPNFKGNRSDPDEVLQHIQQLFYDKLIKSNNPQKQRKVFWMVTTLIPFPCLSDGSLSSLSLSDPSPPRYTKSPENGVVKDATGLSDGVVQIICEYLQHMTIFSQELGLALLAHRTQRLSNLDNNPST